MAPMVLSSWRLHHRGVLDTEQVGKLFLSVAGLSAPLGQPSAL